MNPVSTQLHVATGCSCTAADVMRSRAFIRSIYTESLAAMHVSQLQLQHQHNALGGKLNPIERRLVVRLLAVDERYSSVHRKPPH